MKDWNTLDGWLSPQEGAWLEMEARKHPIIVEIGSYRGRSTVRLGMGARNHGGHVWAIDHFTGSAEHRTNGPIDTYADFTANIAEFGLENNVTTVRASSADALTRVPWPIGLLFIDASHDYDSVREDIRLYSGHVMQGGVVALHDYPHFDGVRRSVDEYLGGNPQWIGRGQAGTIVHFTRG